MHEILEDWLLALAEHNTPNSSDDPSYYIGNAREDLITSSRPGSFKIGTGEQILRDILPSVAKAKFEVLIVTCFYADSTSKTILASALQELSSQARREQRRVRVRICFSTTGFCHTLSRIFSKGQQYLHPPSSWEQLFGLSPSKLTDLDMKISSVFHPPLSVMHPKFIIIDRKQVFLPSCNVSWENWFEGCIQLTGDIVTSLLRFWQHFWGKEDASMGNVAVSANSSSHETDELLLMEPTTSHLPQQYPKLLSETILGLDGVPTVLLPSPHHINPKFRPFFPMAAPPPPTPLNVFLLTIFHKAEKSVFIQTPNLTAPPVLSALYEALRNGVDVKINTSSQMMLLEQLATAGTITELSIRGLQRNHDKLLREYENDPQSFAERGRRQPGALNVNYYIAKEGCSGPSEPVKSHLKLTIVDEEVVILGSGNMDRASWYTSQELGMAFFSKKLAQIIKTDVDTCMEGRVRVNG